MGECQTKLCEAPTYFQRLFQQIRVVITSFNAKDWEPHVGSMDEISYQQYYDIPTAA
jgi:hypothetical protein